MRFLARANEDFRNHDARRDGLDDAGRETRVGQNSKTPPMSFEGRFASDGRRSFEHVESRSPEAGVDPRRADPDDRVSGEVGPRVVANFESRRVVIVNPADVGVEPELPGLERLGRSLHVVPNVGR